MSSVIERVRAREAISPTEVKDSFDERPPVRPSFMLGEWQGLAVLTGNKLVEVLHSVKWAGKNFYGVDQVEPMVCLDDNGCRFCNPNWGGARIREIKYNDTVSAAMVYNQRPVIDHFRYVDENTVIGVMESLDHDKSSQDEDRLYFTLERIK
ncbi:GXWXG protein-domain-containing protein [Aspergillus welwitschiae]|uniref:GXWXG protein-domain-containing protein n=1 Tax=Aspergillus welwitschiae TaxID=1341132 RepID=A0A3F3Q017_9EURO|nr:GXWXG protein-domain-containing protein [Aspergillus welwitschiae]RDH32332.1 GXWXG protein-domain-containing protein [Aspergillus welwitschiae]